ncbi:Alpha/Beta hydrolase fold [Amanita muscaria]
MEIVDVAYSSTSPSNRFDLYLPHPAAPSSPLLCFVHGGAWRSEDKADHADFARRLALKSNCPVVVPNYRLTPKEPTVENGTFRHSGHASDIMECLSFLTSWQGLPEIGTVYDRHRIHLLGHSCGAHMLSSIFLDSSTVTPSLTPPASVLQSVQSIALSEGIYDIDLLLTSFPRYRQWFIESAFGPLSSYSDYAVTKYPVRRPEIRWLVVHSSGDTLVDLCQSQSMYEHLQRSMESCDQDRISHDFHSLTEEHNNIFKSDVFVDVLVQFFLAKVDE